MANPVAAPVYGRALDVYSVDGLQALMADALRVSAALRDRDRILEHLTSQL